MCTAIRISPQATSEEGQNRKHKFDMNTAVVVTIGRQYSTLHIMQNTVIVELPVLLLALRMEYISSTLVNSCSSS